MSQPVQGVAPSILQWARETAGLTHEDVANKLKRDPSDIAGWEAGTGAPTYPQLERLAYEVYKRPLAMFFLPAPPAELTGAALREAVSEVVSRELGSTSLARYTAENFGQKEGRR